VPDPSASGDGAAPGAGDDQAEERRLLFVGMTRARTHLLLSCAARRRKHGATAETGPSPFLAAIEPRLLDRSAPARPRRAPRTSRASIAARWRATSRA